MATKWGIISVGKISHDFTSAVRSLPQTDHQIVAAAARDLERAKQFATLHKIPKAYGSYEELAKDQDVEVVYVGALNKQHFEIGKLLLENGKHVLIEKPMCINLKQTQELISIARKNNRFLMEAMWTRFFPIVKKLSTELSDGTIGEIRHVYVSFGFDIQHAERITKKSLGGGGILDLGVYAAFALLHIFGEEPVHMKSVGKLNDDGVDKCLASSLLFSNDRTAQVAISAAVNMPNEIEIVGTKGIIKVPKFFHCPTKLITPATTYNVELPDTVVPCNYPNSSGLRYEAEAVRQCLLKGMKECPEMSFKDSEMNANIRDQWRRELGVIFPEDA